MENGQPQDWLAGCIEKNFPLARLKSQRLQFIPHVLSEPAIAVIHNKHPRSEVRALNLSKHFRTCTQQKLQRVLTPPVFSDDSIARIGRQSATDRSGRGGFRLVYPGAKRTMQVCRVRLLPQRLEVAVPELRKEQE